MPPNLLPMVSTGIPKVPTMIVERMRTMTVPGRWARYFFHAGPLIWYPFGQNLTSRKLDKAMATAQ